MCCWSPLHRQHAGQAGQRHHRHQPYHGGQGPSAQRRPVVLAVSHQRRAGNAGKNIGLLFNSKNIYFVPMRQDNATGKPTSVVADFTQIVPAVEAALQARQVQPLFC